MKKKQEKRNKCNAQERKTNKGNKREENEKKLD